MKTLKNTLKLMSLTLLIAFASCKKDNNGNTPADSDGTFLKGYYIAGKYTASVNAQDVQLPYILQFFDNAKVTINSGYISNQGNYTYKNGVLTITWDANDKDTFNISNKTITSFSGTSTLATYSLQKTPESNQLNGNTYSGSLKTPGSNIFFFGKIKFNNTQYGQTSLGDPVINTDYTLISNIAGSSTTGGNGKISFFIVIDDKLEVATYTPTNANGAISVSYGTYAKQ